MQKDITTKEAIKAITEDIAFYLIGFKITNVEFVDKELLRIEKREADIVATCIINGVLSLLHIEIQDDNDKDMALRMLRYRLDITKWRSNLPIYQYVIYIGKERLNMPTCIKEEGLSYQYSIGGYARDRLRKSDSS